MWQRIKILFVFTVLISNIACGRVCSDLPMQYTSYNEALYTVKQTTFLFIDEIGLLNSSWIISLKYYSCDRISGFMIIGTKEREYIHQAVPIQIWKQLKEAVSKGSFYNKVFKGKYQLTLSK